jgi:hypothetical protein
VASRRQVSYDAACAQGADGNSYGRGDGRSGEIDFRFAADRGACTGA